MKKSWLFLVNKLYKDQQGQVITYVLLSMLTMLGMGGFMIDLGRLYLVRSQVQLSTNAAGLAAAGDVYNSSSLTSASTIAKNYALKNPAYGLAEDSGYPVVTTKCLALLMISPQTCANTGNVPNALQITERVTMPTTFMSLFGVKSLTVQAQATASMQGITAPWNLAIILDSTGTMQDSDGTSSCASITKMQCTLTGVQDLLKGTAPCEGGLTGSNCTTAGANFRVSLWSIVNMNTSDLALPQTCTGTNSASTYTVLTLPKVGQTSYTPLTYQQSYTSGSPATTTTTSWTSSYELTYPYSGASSDIDANGFTSDYYDPTNTTTGGLYASSPITNIIGYTGSSTKTGCFLVALSGIDLNHATNIGATTPYITSGTNGGTQQTGTTLVNTLGVGEGITAYAPAIYAAQAALTAEQTALGGQNAIIILSDGGANTQWIYFPQGTFSSNPAHLTDNTYVAPTTGTTCTTAQTGTTASTISSTQSSAAYSTLNSCPNYTALAAYYVSSTSAEANGTISGLYPDFFDECQQAIIAAQYATSKATRVYSVAYGSALSGCANYSGSHPDDYTDVSLLASSNFPETLNDSFTLSSLNPCVTMENMATSLSYFFSDNGSNGNCTDSVHNVTTMYGIFEAISLSFGRPRLIPNNAT